MAKKPKNEASSTANVVTPNSVALQGFAGSHFDPSFRTKGSDSPVQRHRKKKPSNKALQHRSPNESATFGESVVAALLGLNEVVRKKGNMWNLYDDHTGVEIGSYKSRKAAWAAQRTRRQQNKFHKKKRVKKPEPVKHAKSKSASAPSKAKPAKAQVPQIKGTPKVKNVKGIKPIKPISPLKPIRPKGLKGRAASNEAFENAVALGILTETTTK